MHRSRFKSNGDRHRLAKPYCHCLYKIRPKQCVHQTGGCACGEHSNISEWNWELPDDSSGISQVIICPDRKQVTFHPLYSSGTAAVRGDTPLVRDYHYYWEVKMLTKTYGTDIMVGLGSNKVDMAGLSTYTSFLGRDKESYGLSYKGALRHNALVCRDNAGFCKGSIIGVKVDLWQGTLEFYINRKSQGTSFYNLRRHRILYPMICSTAAQSSMRLIYAASWKASLLVDAAKVLAASVKGDKALGLPPGLRSMFNNQFWMMLPNLKGILDEDEIKQETKKSSKSNTSTFLSSAGRKGAVTLSQGVFFH